MAGEQWEQVRQLFAQLDESRIAEAGSQWRGFDSLVRSVREDLLDQGPRLGSSGLEGLVLTSIYKTLYKVGEGLDDVAGDVLGVELALTGTATSIGHLREEFAATDADYPSVLSADPDLRLLQEIRLGEYDQVADDYVRQLVAIIRSGAQDVTHSAMFWPPAVPQADPSADLGALGVPAGPP